MRDEISLSRNNSQTFMDISRLRVNIFQFDLILWLRFVRVLDRCFFLQHAFKHGV